MPSVSHEPTHIDLFSGIGGFALAARWAGFRTVAFCEVDKWCQKVLAKNFGCVLPDAHAERCGWWQDDERKESTERARIAACLHGDIRDFDGAKHRGADLLTGGFPCQPFSVAGQRRGKEDDRHLWPEMLRVITEAKPRVILGENVTGIVNMELDAVLSDLEGAGYTCQAFIIPACAVDAKHRRNRVWIVAHADGWRHGTSKSQPNIRDVQDGNGEENVVVADPASGIGRGIQNSCSAEGSRNRDDVFGIGSGIPRATIGEHVTWPIEPRVDRVAHGIPKRLDRIRGLGNAILPQVATPILVAIRQTLLVE